MSQFTIFDSDEYNSNQTIHQHQWQTPSFQGFHHKGPRLQKRPLIKCKGLCIQASYIDELQDIEDISERIGQKYCFVIGQMGCEAVQCPLLQSIDIDLVLHK